MEARVGRDRRFDKRRGRQEWGETSVGRDKCGEREVRGETRGGRTGQELIDKRE